MNLKIGIGAGLAATLLSIWAFTPSGDKKSDSAKAPEIKNAEVPLPETKVAVNPTPTVPAVPETPAAVKVEGNAVIDAPKPEVAAPKPVDPPVVTPPEPAKPSTGESSTTSDPPKKKDESSGSGEGTKQPPPKTNPPKKTKNQPPPKVKQPAKPAKPPRVKQPPPGAQPRNHNQKKPPQPAQPPVNGN